jgi:hypothetical protein
MFIEWLKAEADVTVDALRVPRSESIAATPA